MPSRHSIDAFLDQRQVALVGLSRDPKDFSRAVFDRLNRDGRRVLGVNPHATPGDTAMFARLADVPDPIDAVFVMVPADQADAVVADAIERGVHHIWLHRGAGRGSVSAEAVQRCREHGVDVVDGSCPLMFLEPVGLVHKVHRVFARRHIAA